MPRYGHAVLGGTFDRLHVGHAALIGAAFAWGRRVSIGLTTEALVRSSAKPRRSAIRSYASRRAALARWVRRRFPGRSFRLVPLADRFGRSVEPGVDVLIVSAETAAGGRAVNAERRRRGIRAIPVVEVPVVLADDLRPVSSRRIRAGEIDRRGRRRGPIAIGISADDPRAVAALRAAARRVFPAARISVDARIDASGGSSERSARRRADRAARGRDLGLGAVRTRDGRWVVGESSPEISLDPVELPARSSHDLARRVARLLRPGRSQAL
ncbi:MAG TPA: pantetheine-phosphate adenylyltransferase [Thermoplasmata archaeon]|nr:pantetheine-phosphate adenylyltransferase [Thermoplasmata archaeon]